MALTPGTRLGPYEVLAQIGVGGMGEVYKATDTNLKRSVAIKVLPASVAGDAERLARFQREAEVLAALNHPNIAAIYGLERSGATTALVMELVEGPTLADRIAQGVIPLDEALPIARQICEALEGAHEQGIIHRDLKPANIKVRSDGTVKVLDFGLAKAMEPTAGSSPSLSMSPTITTPAMTQAGMILGTAAYMSPEQAKGRPADKRSDVWAFGSVLYEMLTGKRAFPGDDVSDTLASVLKTEPDWHLVSTAAPHLITRLLRRCLVKDRNQRLPDIGSARLDLQEVQQGGTPVAEIRHIPAKTSRTKWILTGMMIAASIVVGLLLLLLRGTTPATSPRVARFTYQLPSDHVLTRTGRQQVAVSPDGDMLVYVANSQLYLRGMSELLAHPILGTNQDVNGPFFSPDGKWVGFYSFQDSTLKKISVDGGVAQTLCKTTTPYGASWDGDTIVFAQGGTGIFAVPSSGGQPERWVGTSAGETVDSPQLLPTGDVLFDVTTATGTDRWDKAEIVIYSRRSAQRHTVLRGGSAPRYLPDGHLVYAIGENLLAVPFDLARGEAIGTPTRVIEGVMRSIAPGTTGTAHFGVAQDGTLIYMPSDASIEVTRPIWIDRRGQEIATTAPMRRWRNPRISPSGTQVALELDDEEKDIWIWDFARETMRRFTFGNATDAWPVWTPDGRRLVWTNAPFVGRANMMWQDADGTGVAERLMQSPNAQTPYAFAPDGMRLVFQDTPPAATGRSSLRVLTLGSPRKDALLRETSNALVNADISPDGRWIAFESDEGGPPQVYVRSFPDVERGRWQISNGGGTQPVWARGGRELFYRDPSGALMMVDVGATSGFSAGVSKVVLPNSAFPTISGGGRGKRVFDVSPDAERFLILKAASGIDSPTPQIVIVQNWQEELKRLVPTN